MTPADRGAQALLVATALAFLSVGLWALATPAGALGTVGVVAADSTGVVELRAMYGGLEVGATAFFLWCAADVSRLRVGLVGTALMVGGLGAIRAVGVLVDRPDSVLMPGFAVLELSAAALAALLAARRSS